MNLRIKDWASFQHFKDRSPPWVKLYRGLIDDVEWHELEPRAAKALVLLWLIASEYHGNLPPVKKLAFRLRMSEAQVTDVLSKLSHWLERTDIDPISERHQDGTPGGGPNTAAEVSGHQERERETEKETEGEGSGTPLRAEPPAVTLTLIDKTEHPISAAVAAEWQTAYPGVDVLQQLREMKAWCTANPTNRKTVRGVNAFVVRWLGREQDKSGRMPSLYGPAAVAGITVPGSKERDAALVKADEDARRAAKPTEAQRAALAALRKPRPGAEQ